MKRIKNFYSSGFTFVEVLLASFITVFIVAGGAAMWYYFVNNYQFSFETSNSLSVASYNVASMVRELREARDGVGGVYTIVTADDQEFVFFSDIDNDGITERVRYYLVADQLIKQTFKIIPGTQSYACEDKCTICHDGNTLEVDDNAWPAHYAHGDLLGACAGGSGEPGEGTQGGEVSERVVADNVVNGSDPIFYYYNGDWPGDVTNNPLLPGQRLLNTRLVEVVLSIDFSTGPVGPEPVTVRNSAHIRNLKDNL